MKIKIDKLDKIFSKVIRERDDHTCQWCGRQDGTLQCSHHWSRRNLSTRFDPDNAACLCFSCHRRWHENPADGARWLESYLGRGMVDILREKAMATRKMPKWEREEIYQHYKLELKRMEQARLDGKTGRLELVNPL